MLTKLAAACVIAISVLFICPASAQAYLDMGTGSMLLQFIVASLAGIAVFFRLFWDRVKSIFGGSKTQSKSKNGNAAND